MQTLLLASYTAASNACQAKFRKMSNTLHSGLLKYCHYNLKRRSAFKVLMLFLSIFLTTAEAKTHIGIISSAKYCGEREVAWRIKIAAESLGWKVDLDETGGRALRKLTTLDFVICLLPENRFPNPHCPNYITVFHPFKFLDGEGKLLSFYENYHGYLFTMNHIEPIERDFALKNKKLVSMPFYPSVHSIPYRKVELNDLVTMIPVWGNRSNSNKFKKFYNLLSKSGFTKFYGVKNRPEIIEQGYVGEIPFDGVSVIEILQKHGIVLLFHSDIHNANGIPSARIFEAAAASTVIISDENRFVKEHFGDSVFYVDTTRSAASIYQQVLDHLNTIRSDPRQALRMAKTAHRIFEKKFLMSDQLLKLASLNKTSTKKRRYLID